ncbi:MAG: hypothetical protein U1F30_07260 [Steroidobacteraceae bacterium]
MTSINAYWFVAGLLCGAGVAFLLLRARRSERGPDVSAPTAAWPRWALPAAITGLAIVVGLYLWLGHPELIASPPAATPVAPPHAAAGAAAEAGSSAGGGSMDAAVAGLEARLAEGKGSDADWNLLAQSYEFLGRSADAELARKKQLPARRTQVAAPNAAPAARPADAATLKLIDAANVARRARNYAAARDAYVKLVARGTMTADTWADYADVTASLKGGSLAGEAEKYVAEALKLDPHHAKALWLQGSMLHEAGRYTDAIATWERLAAVLEPNSSDAKLVAANIAEDRRLAGVMPGAQPAAGAPAAAGVVVNGEITVADALKSRAAAGQALFIFAKAVGQPGPPVAVLRTTTGQWPLRFRLDDSLSMMPTRTLSSAGKVTIEARISKSGQAVAAAGDLQGASAVLDPRSAGSLRIVIDRVVN